MHYEQKVILYEIRHNGKVKRLEAKDEVLRLAYALERFGYKVKVFMIEVKLYEDKRSLIYQTN